MEIEQSLAAASVDPAVQCIVGQSQSFDDNNMHELLQHSAEVCRDVRQQLTKRRETER